MDYILLKSELISDPLVRGYSSMTDAQAAGDLNSKYRTVPVRVLASHEIFEAIVPSEYDALANTAKDKLKAMLAMGTIDPYGANTSSTFSALFAAGTQTRANLLALRTTAISRAEELGLGVVAPGHVYKARNGSY